MIRPRISRFRLMLSLAVLLIVSASSIAVSSRTATAHYGCGLRVTTPKWFSGEARAWAEFECDRNHYEHHLYARLQKKFGDSWAGVGDYINIRRNWTNFIGGSVHECRGSGYYRIAAYGEARCQCAWITHRIPPESGNLVSPRAWINC
jgi:hypothetical protein